MRLLTDLLSVAWHVMGVAWMTTAGACSVYGLCGWCWCCLQPSLCLGLPPPRDRQQVSNRIQQS
eukprot:COSAG06_NODE_60790_length_269_cov_2.123529_1_plen_63_part_10